MHVLGRRNFCSAELVCGQLLLDSASQSSIGRELYCDSAGSTINTDNTAQPSANCARPLQAGLFLLKVVGRKCRKEEEKSRGHTRHTNIHPVPSANHGMSIVLPPFRHHKIRHVLFLAFFPPFRLPPPPVPPLIVLLSSYELSSASITIFTASSKTWSTPCISLLLHSTYVAPIRFATAWPCSGVTGVRPWVLRRSMHVRLVRRSDFRPTRMRGVVGQKWRTSGYH